MKGKILILEGPRCAGKSYIAEFLSSKRGWDHVKVQRGSDPLDDQINMLGDALDRTDNVVIDRFHLTEYVMSLFLRRRPLAELEIQASFINFELKYLREQFDLDLFVFNPSPLVIEKRLLLRPPDRKADMPPGIAHLVWNSVANKFTWPTIDGGENQLKSFIERYKL